MAVDNALALNANAVSLLTKNGNVQSALKLFRKAFGELRESLVPAIDVADVSCHCTSKDTVSDNVEQYTIRSVAADIEDFSKYQYDNPFCLFQRAILIEGCDQILVPTDRLVSRISAVVTYNMGLAHHLLGLQQNGNSQRTNYTLASRMYKVADTLYRVYPDNGDILVFLAVRNNMAHIHSHFVDNESVQSCLKGINVVLQSSSGDEEKTSENYSPFYLNIMMFYRQITVASPAA
jgi:hypothetical protein